MAVPKTNYMEGSFSTVKTQESVDYMIKCGMPADECQKQLGTHWYCTINRTSEGIYCTYGCKEFPEYNSTDIYLIGVEHEIDSILFGGKAKILFNVTGDNHYDCKADCVLFGKIAWQEDYSEEGLTATMAEKGGMSYKEFWKREASVDQGDLVVGSYTCVKDQAMGDWLVKTGLSKEESQKQVGTHWSCTLKRVHNGLLSTYNCKEFPEWSGADVFLFGKDLDMDCALFGGKAKITFAQPIPNHFDCTADTVNMGKFSWTEDYSPEGMAVHYECKGEHVKEFWARQESMEGWYEYERAENVAEFCKATGADANFEKAITTMKSCFKQNQDDTWTLTESTGGFVAKNTFKLDEEFDYEFPSFPQVNAKLLVTKVDGQTFKMMVKKKDNGRLEEWTYKVCPKGSLFIGTDMASGVSIKLFLKKAANSVYGTFKLVGQAGMEPVFEALGVAPDAAKVAANEDSSFDLVDLGGGNIRFVMRSKVNPCNVVFRWGEQYDIESPLLPGAIIKNISTLSGDKMVTVSKAPSGTVRMIFNIGETFCSEETVFLGSNLSYKGIFERV